MIMVILINNLEKKNRCLICNTKNEDHVKGSENISNSPTHNLLIQGLSITVIHN